MFFRFFHLTNLEDKRLICWCDKLSCSLGFLIAYLFSVLFQSRGELDAEQEVVPVNEQEEEDNDQQVQREEEQEEREDKEEGEEAKTGMGTSFSEVLRKAKEVSLSTVSHYEYVKLRI